MRENNINEKVTKEEMVIFGDLLQKYSPEFLKEKVRDTDGYWRERWQILKERQQ